MENSALKLDNQLCFRVYTASRLMIRLYKPFLDKLKLTYPQYVTMLVLWESNEIGFRDLGKKLYMQTGTLTPIIQRLEKLGYVKKMRDPKDDRRVIVMLTDSGEALIPEARKIPNELASSMGLTRDEFTVYAKALDDLTAKLNDADLKHTKEQK